MANVIIVKPLLLSTFYLQNYNVRKKREPLEPYMPIHPYILYTYIYGSMRACINTQRGEQSIRRSASLGKEALPPPIRTLIRVAQDCRRSKNAEKSKQFYLRLCKHKLESHGDLGNYLVPMFVDCGSMDMAMSLFHRLSLRKEHSWTSLIHGCIQAGKPHEALSLYKKMQEEYVYPSKFTFTALLKACATLRMVAEAQELHVELVKKGLETELFLGSTFVDLYSKCGLLEEASLVFQSLPFRTSVSWSSWLFGLIEHGRGGEALNQFMEMQREGVRPDAIAYVCVSKACGAVGDLEMVHTLHHLVMKEGLYKDPSLHHSLVAMYIECSLLAEAQSVFDDVHIKDLITWTVLIRGYVDHGYNEEALHCLHRMEVEDFVPDLLSYIYCLKACGTLGALTKGKEIHSQIIRRGDSLNVDEQVREHNDLVLTTSLIDMYSKCGSMEDAQKLFDVMPSQDLVAWTTLIAGYAFKGMSELVFSYFEKMVIEGIKPDQIVFVSLLIACTHDGHLDQAQTYFETMVEGYSIIPVIDHFNCIVDLLGRAGQVICAIRLLEKLPIEPDLVTWNTILSSCRRLGDVDLARHAFDCVLKLDEGHVGAYILMANVYMDAQMWENAKTVEIMGGLNNAHMFLDI